MDIEKTKEALTKLDVKNDAHWTEAKTPRMETVKLFASDQSITKESLDGAFPNFNRDNAGVYFMTWQKPATKGEQGGEGQAPVLTPESAGTPTQPAPQPPQQHEGGGAPFGETPLTPRTEGGATASEAPVTGSGDQAAEGAQDGGPGTDDADADDEDGAISTLDLDAFLSTLSSSETVEEAFSAVQGAIGERRREVDRLNAEIGQLMPIEEKLDRKLQRLSRDNGNKTTNTIQDYLEAQRQRGVERGEMRKALKESGVSLKELGKLAGKSPIDESRARKTGR